VKTIPVKVTYLQMFSRPGPNHEPLREDLRILRAENPTIAFYRFLYDTVGRDWNWVDRKLMSDDQLGRIIRDDRVEIYVLYVRGVPAGYIELDRRVDDEVEFAYFGIMREFIGRGLGPLLFRWAVDRAWSYGPKRVWLHTCELDHEAALPLYLRAGFEIFDEQVIDQVVL